MCVHRVACCLLVALLGVVVPGCQNQQADLDDLMGAAIVEGNVDQAASNASQLDAGWLPGRRRTCETERERLQKELDAMKIIAAESRIAADQALVAEKQRADDAIQDAARARDQAAAAVEAAQKQVAEAEQEVAHLQQELAHANAKIVHLEAMLGEIQKTNDQS